MIREHAFNTAWFGAPVGIAESAFFDLSSAEQRALLAPYAFVEFACEAPPSALRARVGEAGFRFVDVQMHFRVGLRQRSAPASAVDVQFAAAEPFEIGDGEMPSFATERFRHVPGMTEERLAARYRHWAGMLLKEAPADCVRVLHRGVVQGWFLARPAAPGLQLALAFRHREGTLSGHAIYEAALDAYARKGHQLGWASFSANNTAVLNIYASLGARFVTPTEHYLWVPDRA